MTTKKDLWGDFPKTDTIQTPYTILKEQASLLDKKTNGLLIGEVKLSQSVEFETSLKVMFSEENQQNQSLVAFLRIQAPSLNNYTYSVVRVQYPMPQLYPVSVKSLAVEDFQRECSSKEEFEQTLGAILSSNEVKRVILALLAQIQADIPQQ